MKVLIACEESQRSCIEFRKRGHEAYSCDVQECSGGYPEWHIRQDVTPLLNGGVVFRTEDGNLHEIGGKWDLIIAHPPCTYLTGASAVELSKHPERLQKGFEAAEFLKTILSADCEKIAIENPPPMKRFNLPKYDQLIRAYKVGEPHTKAYCFWLKGLPPLSVDETAEKPKAEYKRYCKSKGKVMTMSLWYSRSAGKNHSKIRSKTPIGLAVRMAEQWGGGNNDPER